MIIVTDYLESDLTDMSRKSKQKETILRVLKETDSHPTANWIYEQAKQEIPSISLGTVYRNLKLLKQDGMIRELDFGDNQSRFDGNNQDHYHFRCEGCGRIVDLAVPVDRMLNESVARETGFQVMHHRLEFSGLCRNCT
ncbi:MAG: transcriptional repressor [Chloroflexi bacterium]|nr:transcriptional repressor [Chloroflexota bacterium]